MFIFFFQSRSLAEPLATSRGTLGFRGTPVEKPRSMDTIGRVFNHLKPSSRRRHRHHHHVAIKELGHLLTRSGVTHPEVSSWSSLVLLPFGV
jgi:hypothetical protein